MIMRQNNADEVQPTAVVVWAIAICVIAVLLKCMFQVVTRGMFLVGAPLSEAR